MEPEVEPRLKKGESSLKRLEKETRWRALIVCMTPSTWLQSLAAAAAATAVVTRSSCCIGLKSITRWPGSLPNFNQNFPTITIVHTYVRHRYFSYIDNGAAKLMHECSGAHSANFDEKVHKPQSWYANWSTKMHLVSFHISYEVEHFHQCIITFWGLRDSKGPIWMD